MVVFEKLDNLKYNVLLSLISLCSDKFSIFRKCYINNSYCLDCENFARQFNVPGATINPYTNLTGTVQHSCRQYQPAHQPYRYNSTFPAPLSTLQEQSNVSSAIINPYTHLTGTVQHSCRHYQHYQS